MPSSLRKKEDERSSGFFPWGWLWSFSMFKKELEPKMISVPLWSKQQIFMNPIKLLMLQRFWNLLLGCSFGTSPAIDRRASVKDWINIPLLLHFVPTKCCVIRWKGTVGVQSHPLRGHLSPSLVMVKDRTSHKIFNLNPTLPHKCVLTHGITHESLARTPLTCPTIWLPAEVWSIDVVQQIIFLLLPFINHGKWPSMILTNTRASLKVGLDNCFFFFKRSNSFHLGPCFSFWLA